MMETEVKMLKTKEEEGQKASKGIEELMADKIPLNENFLCLKQSFNNEKDKLKKVHFKE